jgi:DNA polymerase-3 subunit delta'
MAHAYLFRGPAGVGKKRAAHTLAALCNCLAPRDGDACTVCASCVKFAANSHPDLLELAPIKGIIKIDQVRALQKGLRFAPHEAKVRFVLLPDVHLTMQRKETANSLLKTLEEPPADTILVLTADESGKVLPTILSRCQVIPFFPLPCDEVAQTLATTDGMDLDTATALARVAEGSLGRARFLHDKGLLAERASIAATLCRCPAGSPASTGPILALADQAAARKDDLPELLSLLALWFRDLILLRMGAPDKHLTSPDLARLLPTAGERWSLPRLQRNLDLLRAARKQLSHNCRGALVCEVLFFALL